MKADSLIEENWQKSVTDMTKSGKGIMLRVSVIHQVQILVHFGRNFVVLYPRSISNQSLEIWVPRNLTYILKTSRTWSVPHLQGQESIYTAKVKDVQRIDLMTLLLLLSLSEKTAMDILVFKKLVRIAGERTIESLLCIINDSISNGTFPDDWELLVLPLFIRITEK